MVIIFGGSFNPPTIAHRNIALKLMQKYKPERFIFVPVGDDYLKPELAKFQFRYEMIEILAKAIGAEVSDIENRLGYFGTYQTLKTFKTKSSQVYFVLGADNLIYLHKWIRAKKMVKSFRFIILNRNGIDVDSYINEHFPRYNDHFLIECFDSSVSSTIVRKTHNLNDVPDVIKEYIIAQNLYIEV